MALSLNGGFRSEESKAELESLLEEQEQQEEDADNELILETMAILADVLRRGGDIQGSLEMSEKTYQRRRDILGANHQDTLESAMTLAITLLKHGSRLPEATALMQDVCDTREKILGVDHPDTFLSCGNLAMLLEKQGHYVEAAAKQVKALDGLTRVLGATHSDTLTAFNNLAHLYRLEGHFQDAESFYRIAYEGFSENENFGQGHVHTLIAKTNIAVCLREQGSLDDASVLYDQVLKAYSDAGKKNSPDALNCMMNQSALQCARHNYAAAEEKAWDAADGYRLLYTEHSPRYCIALGFVSRALIKQKRFEDAEQVSREAHAGLNSVCGPENADSLEATALLAHVVRCRVRTEEACSLYREAARGFRHRGNDQHWCHGHLRKLENSQASNAG